MPQLDKQYRNQKRQPSDAHSIDYQSAYQVLLKAYLRHHPQMATQTHSKGKKK